MRLPDGDLEVVPLEDGVDLTGMGDVALHHVVQLKQPVEPSEKNRGRQRCHSDRSKSRKSRESLFLLPKINANVTQRTFQMLPWLAHCNFRCQKEVSMASAF